MNWEEFFRPTIVKIILVATLIIIVSFIPQKVVICSMGPEGLVCGKRISDYHIGYPGFYGDIGSSDAIVYSLSMPLLIINIMMYYIVASLLITIFNKLKKQNKKI